MAGHTLHGRRALAVLTTRHPLVMPTPIVALTGKFRHRVAVHAAWRAHHLGDLFESSHRFLVIAGGLAEDRTYSPKHERRTDAKAAHERAAAREMYAGINHRPRECASA
jgi:hypothetical protein